MLAQLQRHIDRVGDAVGDQLIQLLPSLRDGRHLGVPQAVGLADIVEDMIYDLIAVMLRILPE